MKLAIAAMCMLSAVGGSANASATTAVAPRSVNEMRQIAHPDTQVEKITCREFLGLQRQFQPQAVSYVIGYNKAKKPDDAVLDIEGISRIVPVVQESCRATPERTLIQRIRADLHRL